MTLLRPERSIPAILKRYLSRFSSIHSGPVSGLTREEMVKSSPTLIRVLPLMMLVKSGTADPPFFEVTAQVVNEIAMDLPRPT
jgi:hypothetical protein